MWFFMGCVLFVFTWYNIIRLVMFRFSQFMTDEAKKIRAPLKLSLSLYFTIWCGYPALWILDEFGFVPGMAVHVLSMIMDVAAKSVYGFALLKFQLGIDKIDCEFDEIRTTDPTFKEMPTLRGSRSRLSKGHHDDVDRFAGGWDSRDGVEANSGEIEKTMSQIADLNKQLATLTANEGQGGHI